MLALPDEYSYRSSEPPFADGYLVTPVLALLGEPRRVLEVGCGNGATAARIAAAGHSVVAVEPSVSGVQVARTAHSSVQFERRSGYDDLAGEFGLFDAVVSIEVIEHVYSPRLLVSRMRDALRPGGLMILTTPYHGYLKNLGLALAGKMDGHYAPLWDHGHIKFWSRRTLSALLSEAGLVEVSFSRVGRAVPQFAKSMLLVWRRPASE